MVRTTAVLAWTLASIAGCGAARLVAHGDGRDLRPGREPSTDPRAPSVLILGLDGVGRSALDASLEAGEVPELAALLGGVERGELAHAHLVSALTTLPSSTLPAWSTIFTGEPPAVHGIAGNEHFERATRTLFAGAPVSLGTRDPVLRTYTEDYVGAHLRAPTLYERLRARDPAITSWVAGSQIHRGADRLLLPDASILGEAFGALLGGVEGSFDAAAAIDRNTVENVVEELAERDAPRVLTVYLPGADLYAHGAEEGPERAIRRFLREAVDPAIGTLARALDAHGALADRHVIVVADHGHTEVVHDAAHALEPGDGEDDPPAVLRAAGFRLRPFELEVGEDADFDTVLAYGGALAYAYVADRSTCPRAGTGCDWARPARFEEDVLPLAAALARGLAHALDLVIVRRGSELLALEGGRPEPLEPRLATRRAYVATLERLRELAIGPHGDHAGDVILVARQGGEPDPAQRFYFSRQYRSWHGSPSRADSEVPLILAHPARSRDELARALRAVTGPRPRTAHVTPLVEALLLPRDRP